MDKELIQVISELYQKNELEIITSEYRVYGNIHIVVYANKFYRLLYNFVTEQATLSEVKPKQVTTTEWVPV